MIALNNIEDSNQKGTVGEDIIRKVLSTVAPVVDVRKNKKYQKLDVDFIFKDKKVEAKSDSCYNTGNYFFEVVSNAEKSTPGWAVYSEADYILIYYPAAGEIHSIYGQDLRDWLVNNSYRFPMITNSTSGRENKLLYHSMGVLVNRELFAKEVGAEILKVSDFIQ